MPESDASDLCLIYQDLLCYAKEHEWPSEKRIFIHQRMLDYTFWRCRLSSPVVRKKLVTEMHRLLQPFDMEQQKEARSDSKVKQAVQTIQTLKEPGVFSCGWIV